MYLGILIGLSFWGYFLQRNNPRRFGDSGQAVLIKSLARVIGQGLQIIGFCGAIGWLAEVIF